MSVIFVFVDGVGLAPAGPDNPLTAEATPGLAALLGGPLALEQARPGIPGHSVHSEFRATAGRGTVTRSSLSQPSVSSASSAADRAVLFMAIDATLGVAGLPQSGTGQTALLAGFNAAAQNGRHQPHFPPTALRAALAERSIFRRVALAGGDPAFANLFGPGYWEALAARRVRRSASVIAAEGAGVRFRDEQDLRRGRAVAWDITGDALRARGVSAPPSAPAQAGAALARLAADHRLVFFETFLPDLAGHGRLTRDRGPRTGSPAPRVQDQRTSDQTGAQYQGEERDVWAVHDQILEAMRRIDGMLIGALAALRPQDTLLLTSDHGNVESLAAPAHTRNPVPLLVVGPGAAEFAGVADIAQVADALERVALG